MLNDEENPEAKLTGKALEMAIKNCPPELRRLHSYGRKQCEGKGCSVLLNKGYILCYRCEISKQREVLRGIKSK